jgi:hypothetical protein
MVYISKFQLLITSSTDRTMRVWRIDKTRSLLHYPWFIEYQRASGFISADVLGAQLSGNSYYWGQLWLTCFDHKVSDTLSLYAGDSEGSIYLFKSSRELDETPQLSLDQKMEAQHKNGII